MLYNDTLSIFIPGHLADITIDLSETSAQDDPLPNAVRLPTAGTTGNVAAALTPALGLYHSSRVRQPPDCLSYGPSNCSF